MREIIINCANLPAREAFFEIINRELGISGSCSRNLDALHDCLTSVCTQTRIILVHFSALPFPSGGLLRVLRDSEAENPMLEISFVTN